MDSEVQNRLEELERRIMYLENEFLRRGTKKLDTKKGSISSYLLESLRLGFFDTPRSLNEIATALSEIGFVYPTTSLTGPLQRMLRKRQIGRIKKDGRWFYVKR